MNMTKSSQIIFIADADARNTHLLQRYLQVEGFTPIVFNNSNDLHAQLQRQKPAALVLDRSFSDQGGAQLCQALREQSYDFPILMLLGKGDDTRSFVNNRVGADACMRKILSPLRLLDKLNGLLALDAQVPTQPIVFGEYVFDLAASSLSKSGKSVPLTAGDCSMLRALALRPHQALGREDLSLLARGRLYEPFDRSLDVQLSRLRKLIEDDNRAPRYLQTVWGSGYMFVPDGHRQTDKIVKP
ncbi:MAG: winged helix-turn-helix domain-containing protein [Brachymonas sp.]|jgi:two-component system phosphate regulon response regulator OmpR